MLNTSYLLILLLFLLGVKKSRQSPSVLAFLGNKTPFWL